MNSKRYKTRYPGVYYREARRIGVNSAQIERVYYIVFKKVGKMLEEKVGRQYSDNMTPAKAAKIRLDRIEGRRPSPKELREEREKIRISAHHRWTFDRIWDEYKSIRPLKSLKPDENRYQKHLAELFGSKEPGEISPTDVDQFRFSLLKNYKAATVANIMELLRRLINFAKKRRLCSVPDFQIELPRANNEKTEDLTPEQLSKLLEVLNKDPNRTAANMMKLALFTGMRRGEMFSLKWSDIDSNRGFILLRDPKGGQDQKIPLNDPAKDIFEEQSKISDYVFAGRGGRQRVDINKAVNRIKNEAGLPKDFRPLHGLRHVFASMLASSGQVDLYTIQKLLTHKSPAMTQRYAHLRDETLKNASNLIGEIISNNPEM